MGPAGAMPKAKKKKSVCMIERARLQRLVDQQNRVLAAECAADATITKGLKRLESERRHLAALMITTGVETPVVT